MGRVIDRRVSAGIDGDLVVFLIGMRVNRPWKVHRWLPVMRAMPRMLKELASRPESGFLGCEILGLRGMVQYWRSFEALEAYARDPEAAHWPAWVDFNRKLRHSRGDVGIWHETYLVRDGAYETLYSGMPPFGLARATAIVDAAPAARERMRRAA
jgi:hypothetical protein